MKKNMVFRSGKRRKIAFETESEIKEILGSTTIKTPFLVSVPREIVLAEIGKRNPEHHVYLSNGDGKPVFGKTILPAVFVSAMVFWWIVLYLVAKLSQ